MLYQFVKNNLFIIHFQPVELYPPIQNILGILENVESDLNTTVLSTNVEAKQTSHTVSTKRIKLVKVNVKSRFRFLRFLKHQYFYLKAFLLFLLYKPDKILYFESISAAPVLLFKLLRPKTKVFVHYHEYTSPDEYKTGMKLVQFNHLLEKKMFVRFDWISQTNQKRLSFFHEDNPKINTTILKVMPNYPSVDWALKEKTYPKDFEINEPIRMVYIGAISEEDTYIKEIIDFVKSEPSKYDLELFSFNLDMNTRAYIETNNVSNVRFSGALEYSEIPKVLSKKAIGLILYKGNTLNYIYNAPNKLFEYLACGLDVWYPKEMLGCSDYKSDESPKVFEVDFLNIQKSIIGYNLGKKNNLCIEKEYSAEMATKTLIGKLLND